MKTFSRLNQTWPKRRWWMSGPSQVAARTRIVLVPHRCGLAFGPPGHHHQHAPRKQPTRLSVLARTRNASLAVRFALCPAPRSRPPPGHRGARRAKEQGTRGQRRPASRPPQATATTNSSPLKLLLHETHALIEPAVQVYRSYQDQGDFNSAQSVG